MSFIRIPSLFLIFMAFIVRATEIDSDNSTSCDQQNCLYCNEDGGNCLECRDGFGVDLSSGTCTNCLYTHCQLCTQNYLNCTKCHKGYGLSNPSYNNQFYTCSKCSLQCKQCTYYYQCVLCEDGYFVDGGWCRSCGQGCLECQNGGVCLLCRQGYALTPIQNGNRSCQPCIQNCRKCQQNDSSICLQCNNNNFILNDSECVKCSQFFDGCLMCSDQQKCQHCKDGFFLKEGHCEKCSFGCIKCNEFQNEGDCLKCDTGLQISDTSPKKCGFLCHQELLFDQIDCQFEKGIELDGCTDECQKQEGFNCTENENGIIDVCSYEKQINIEINSVQRETLSNRLIVTFTVSPLLHVFTLTDLRPLFRIDLEGFAVSDFTFDELSATVTMKVDFERDSQNEELSLWFVPEVSHDGSFFATPNTSKTVSLGQLTHYAAPSLTMGKWVPILSTAVVCLGWTNIALSLVSKRLAGIIAFLVLQLTWATFTWVDMPMFEPMQGTSVFQFLTFYNDKEFLLIPQTQTQTKQTQKYKTETQRLLQQNDNNDKDEPLYSDYLSKEIPHSEMFGLRTHSFVNNFNFALLFQIVPFALFFVSGMLLCFYIRKLKNLTFQYGGIVEEEDIQFSKLKVHINRLTIVKEYAAQILLCFTTINLFHFATSLFLFFFYAAPPFHVEELAAVAVSGVLLAVTLGCFWYDPDPFNFFRYSFRRQPLALCHFNMLVLCSLCSLLSMFFLGELAWVSVVPMAVLSVFTVIYKPFKEVKENYHSFVCSLVATSVLCFHVYARYSATNKNVVATFAFVVIVLSALVVLGLGTLALLIYKLVYVCYLLPRMEKDEKEKILIELDMTTLNRKIKESALDDSVYRKLIRRQMNILKFSNHLSDLAADKCLVSPDSLSFAKKDRRETYSNILKEERIHRFGSIQKNNKLDKLESLEKENSFHNDYYSEYERQLNKINQNLEDNFEEYRKNQEDIEVIREVNNEKAKEESQKVYALQIAVEENDFLRLKNAQQFSNAHKGAHKDEVHFIEAYENINCSKLV